jgi:hypothetical protein
MRNSLTTNAKGLSLADLDEDLLSGLAKSAGESALQSAKRDLVVAGLVDGRFASVPAKNLLLSMRRSKDHEQSVVTTGDLIVNLDQKTVEVSGTRVHLTGEG